MRTKAPLPFSVLISVYCKEQPERLRAALRSVWQDQTLRPTEIVLVKDGPLPEELDAVIEEYSVERPLVVVALPKNQGLGLALNTGLQHCSCELVARMDSDDLAKPNRFERQVTFMVAHPEIAVCGSWTDEFVGEKEQVVSQRRLPEHPKELNTFGKKRNPMNHPTVIFRKSAVMAVGGYEHFPLFEDYWLWARLLYAGYQLYNIQKPLLWFRTSPDLYRRRGNWQYAKTELRFQYRLWRLGYISLIRMCANDVVRFGVRLLPNSLRKFLYRKMLR